MLLKKTLQLDTPLVTVTRLHVQTNGENSLPSTDVSTQREADTLMLLHAAELCASSCGWQLGCRVAIILLERDYAADVVPLYQYTGTPFADLGRMKG